MNSENIDPDYDELISVINKYSKNNEEKNEFLTKLHNFTTKFNVCLFEFLRKKVYMESRIATMEEKIKKLENENKMLKESIIVKNKKIRLYVNVVRFYENTRKIDKNAIGILITQIIMLYVYWKIFV